MLSLQRSFSVIPAALIPGHPYRFKSSSTLGTVHFFEFRGFGPPSTDFGHAGDIYVDLTPRLHALYWRDRDIVRGVGAGEWRRWTALLLDKVPLHKFLVSHPWARDPESSDLYLWVDPGGITWTSKDSLCSSRVQMIQRNIATFAPGTVPDVEALVSEVLHRMLNAEHTSNAALNHRSQSPTLNPMPSSPYVEQTPRAGSSFQTFRLPAPGLMPIHPHGGADSHFRVQTQSPQNSFRSDHHPASFFTNEYGTRSVAFGQPASTSANCINPLRQSEKII